MPQIMWDKPKNTPNINSTQIQKKRAEQQIKEGVLFCFYENQIQYTTYHHWIGAMPAAEMKWMMMGPDHLYANEVEEFQ